MPETNRADDQGQLAKEAEARKKSIEEAAKRMETAKPTPTQEENDRARLGETLWKRPTTAAGRKCKFHAAASGSRPAKTSRRGQLCHAAT